MNGTASQHGGQKGFGGFRVDISRGERIGRVSSERFARPDDERYLNLPELYAAVQGRAERARRPAPSKADLSASTLPETTPSGWP